MQKNIFFPKKNYFTAELPSFSLSFHPLLKIPPQKIDLVRGFAVE